MDSKEKLIQLIRHMNDGDREDLNNRVEGFIETLKEEILEELKEDEPKVYVTVRSIFDAGSNCIDEVGINPWYLNEGGNPDSTYPVKQNIAIRYGLEIV